MVIALLNAYQDLLDYDGMKSIIREAKSSELLKVPSVDPNQLIEFEILQKIIAAQSLLLFKSYKLLEEIGRKFSLYLFPYGDKIENYIKQLKDYILMDWNIEILSISTSETEKIEKIQIKLRNCIFKSPLDGSYDFSIGLLSQTIEKSIGMDKVTDIKLSEVSESEVIIDFLF